MKYYNYLQLFYIINYFQILYLILFNKYKYIKNINKLRLNCLYINILRFMIQKL